MDFLTLLDNEHSKETTVKIVSQIRKNPQRMKELMNVFFDHSTKLTQRAAWPLSYIGEKQPRLLDEYQVMLVNVLHQKNNHDAVNRNILRAFQFLTIKEEVQGELLDVCFSFLVSAKQPVAVKAFSITIVYNLSLIYPEIKPEFIATMKSLLPNASSGLKGKVNKTLKLLTK